MKTKLLLLCGALIAACSLTSCDIYGYPGYGYGYGGYGGYGGYNRYGSYGSPYYSSYAPLLGLSTFYGGYSRPYAYNSSYRSYYPYRSYSSYGYNRGNYGSSLLSHSSFANFGRSFGGSSYPSMHRTLHGDSIGFRGVPFSGGHSFGGSSFGGHTLHGGGGSFGGSSFGGGHTLHGGGSFGGGHSGGHGGHHH